MSAEWLNFVKLISDVSGMSGRSLSNQEIDRIAQNFGRDRLGPKTGYPVKESELLDMFQAMISGRKIEAIKIYRALTGAELQLAKDAVELVMTTKVRY